MISDHEWWLIALVVLRNVYYKINKEKGIPYHILQCFSSITDKIDTNARK